MTLSTLLPSTVQPALLWDIFCQVIDNHGDLGVCWRLSRDLATRGQRVRLWIDDASALSWMAPVAYRGLEVRIWTPMLNMQGLAPSDVWVEAFGCNIAPEFIATYANAINSEGRKHIWINLEYLSAQAYVERNHGLNSPIMSGPGMGLSKHFFYPGFTSGTGGLLRETNLLDRQADFDRDAWLQAIGCVRRQGERLISLFCYEPRALAPLLRQLAADTTPTRLLVTAGRATAATQIAVQSISEKENGLNPSWNKHGNLSISYLPYLSQDDFDHLLWACDLNFVRGEDSLVRALWAGKPLIWQIYPQHDDAHHDKLDAFLNMLQAPESLRQVHRHWNDIHRTDDWCSLPLTALQAWGETCQAARQRLLQQNDLMSQLLGFVRAHGV